VVLVKRWDGKLKNIPPRPSLRREGAVFDGNENSSKKTKSPFEGGFRGMSRVKYIPPPALPSKGGGGFLLPFKNPKTKSPFEGGFRGMY
jgi:hypothetical protein